MRVARNDNAGELLAPVRFAVGGERINSARLVSQRAVNFGREGVTAVNSADFIPDDESRIAFGQFFNGGVVYCEHVVFIGQYAVVVVPVAAEQVGYGD